METAKKRFSAFIVDLPEVAGLTAVCVNCNVLLAFDDLVADEASGFGASSGVVIGHSAAAGHAQHHCRGKGAH
jgi:hypothetical protein